MPKRTSNAYLILDQKLLYDEDRRISTDTAEFTDWLHTNGSFRVEAGDNGYRARKESYHSVPYWYGVKKVSGRLIKRYIGKTTELSHERLVEIANHIRQPYAPTPEGIKKTRDEGIAVKQEMVALDAKITAIQQQLDLLVKPEEPKPPWLNRDQVRKIILDTATKHLKNFHVTKRADSKALYEGRLSSFVELLIEQLLLN